MYKYPVRKISISKLNDICQYISVDLEARSDVEEYNAIYKKYINSRSGFIYLNYNELDLISLIYEDDNTIDRAQLQKLLYGRKAVTESYKSDVDEFYNDLKELLIDTNPNNSLILTTVYDDLYKNNIRLDIVQRYADIDFDYYQMLLARKALLSGLDDIEMDFILGTKLSQDQQSEIINALRTDVPYLTVKSWLKQNFTPAQIELATRCYVMGIRQTDTDYLTSLNLDDEMTQYVKQAIQYKIPVSKIKEYLEPDVPLIEFKRAIRQAKNLERAKLLQQI